MVSVNGNNISLDSMGLLTAKEKWERTNTVDTLCELIYVLEGNLCINDSNDYNLIEGNMVVLKPNKKSRNYYCTPKTMFYWVKFYCDSPETLVNGRAFFDEVKCSHLLKEMLHYHYIYKEDNILSELIFSQLIVHNTHFPYEKHTKKLTADMYEMIRLNSSAKLKASDVAEVYGYNKNHLSRMLMREYGVGIKALIDRFVIDKAKKYLLNSNFSIKEISVFLKFETENAFVKFYKYHEGITPTHYRSKFSTTRTKEISLNEITKK